MLRHPNVPALTLAIATALSLSACGGGGGGGNVRPTPPPTVPQVCQDPTATNQGGALPCTYRYNGRDDNLLVPTNADIAHSEGFTGKGVKVGLLDDGWHKGYAPLEGQVAWYQDVTGHEGEKDPSPKDGHGNAVGTALAGKPVAGFKGGVAPEASLYWSRVCYNDSCGIAASAKAVQKMAGLGVRLFNASFSSPSAGAEGTAPIFTQFSNDALLTVDGLMVNSTGNLSESDAGAMGLIPLYDSRYLGHWLAVTAVEVDTKGNATGKSSYANACGRAAQWCLAAPGLVQVPGIPVDNYHKDGLTQGTSNAAPQVTGAAALVWQAFPWMSATNVQQTILTTATDLGAAGVDAVYGWGLLNVAKAVHGPGQLVGTFDANVFGSGTFSNAITGAGNLVKRGSGTLTLSGANTWTGGSRVEAGTLMLTGALGSSVVVNGGTFGSKGGKITGDYTVNASGTTALQVGTGLSITGNANLAGTLQLLPENTDYTVKATETLLTAGKVNGTFGKVTYGSGFFWTAALSYTDTQVNAALTRAAVAASAASAGASLAAVNGGAQADVFLARVDGLATAGMASESMQAMAGKLASAPTVAVALASLASLTGEIHGTARTAGVRQALNAGSLLADRTRSLGAFGDAGVWVQASDNTGKLRRDGYSAARYSNTGAMIGVDTELDSGVTVGAAIGGNRNRANLDGLGGRFDGTGTTLAGYGRAKLGDAGYIAGNVSIERNRVDTDRTVVVGTTASGVTADRTDTTVQARIEAGWTLASGLSPYIAASALRHTQGDFSEAGGEGFGLTAGEDSLTATFAELGLRFDRAIGQWVVGGDMSARRLLGGADTGFAAAFTGAPTAAFDVAGQALGKDSFRVVGHAFYRTAQGWIVYVTAGTERGTGQRSNGYATAGVKVGF